MTTPQPPQRPETQPDATNSRVWWKKKRIVIPAGVFVALLAISPFVPTEDETTSAADETTTTEATQTTAANGDSPSTTTPVADEASVPSTAEPSTTTTQPATTTTTTTEPAPVESAEICDNDGISFETMPGVSCDEVFEQTQEILLTFDDWKNVTDQGVWLEAAVTCLTVNGDEPKTYEPESLYAPALAEALAGKLCPGSPDMLIPK